ncbi:MAG TPA: heparinase II/III family protein, partial [Gemmatimonadales bacterium]|nr:heparinase II/III family protein [Gemmatimonadales bacterium]
MKPGRAGEIIVWLRGHRRGMIRAVLAAVGLIAVLGSWYAFSRNSIDLIAALDPAAPLARDVKRAETDGGRAAGLQLMAAHFRARPLRSNVPPHQVWDLDPAQTAHTASLALENLGALWGHPFPWGPGTKVAWLSGDHELLFHLQRQLFLFDLITQWQTRPQPALLSFAAGFMAEWQRGNAFWPSVNPYVWNDDAMSNRIDAWLWLMEARRKAGFTSEEEELAFLRSLLRHAAHLLNDDEHNFQTNHGMQQNLALLSIAVNYPEFQDAAMWRRVAIQRSLRFVEEATSTKGSFKEVAPEYQLFGLTLLTSFYAICRSADIELPGWITQRLRMMATFTRALLRPDGSFPLVGDTRPMRVCSEGWPWPLLPTWPELAEFRHATSGQLLPPNEPGIDVDEEAGYFILRAPGPTWTREKALMVTMQFGPPSRAHGHLDKLSVTLYGGGTPLLDGPGYPSWWDGSRVAMIATPEQNTVDVDGLSQAAGEATIGFQWFPDGVAKPVLFQARSSLYRGVIHRRTLAYGSSPSEVLIIDEMISGNHHQYSAHFRLAPGLDGQILGATVVGTVGGRVMIELNSWLVQGASITRPRVTLEGRKATFGAPGANIALVTLLSTTGKRSKI